MTARAHRRLVPLSCLALIVSLGAVAVGTQAAQKTIFVSVIDDKGKPVTDMTAADFAIREDNIDREIVSVKKSEQPLAIVLLIDTTTEAQVFIQDIRAGLKAFVETIAKESPQSQMALWEFGQAAVEIKDFTSDHQEFLKATARVYPKQRAASVLLEALDATTRALARQKTPRRAIVIVNVEPSKEVSSQQPQRVLTSLIASRSQVWAVSVQKGSLENPARDIVLNRFVQVGGGRREVVFTDNAVEVLMRDYASSLAHQYEVTYARPSGTPQIVQVGARRDGVKVLAGIAAPQ
ncbi:MAG: VWA domain-containing protein [Vicinamibacterales bacterium]